MEIGSVLNLNPVTLSVATISECSRVGSGFTYGYSTSNDGTKDGNNPPSVKGTSTLVGSYSLVETYSPTTIGNVRTTSSSENYANVKFGSGNIVIGKGINNITITATSPSGSYTHPEYPKYFIISNLGNTDANKILAKADETSGTIGSVIDSTSISVTGVYPVYVNISSGEFIDETIKMTLTSSKVFEFNVPSEVLYNKHFTFDYPATHSVVSFEIKDLTGNYVSYSATYDAESEIITKVVAGQNVQYKRFVTTGKLQGEGTYKITWSKGLDK